MAFVENIAKRTYSGRVYVDAGIKRASISLARLHYESVLGSGVHDAEINCDPVRVSNPVFDGWRITSNGWHFAVGQPVNKSDGWVGFGGRKGQNWFQFRLHRIGYLHYPTRDWQDIGGAPDYDRANLSRSTQSITIGPNADPVNIGSQAEWRNLWSTPGGGECSVRWRVNGDGLKEDVVLNQSAREWIAANRPPETSVPETYFGFVFKLDWSEIPKIVKDSIEQSDSSDFGADGSVELQDAADRLLAFLPIDYVSVGSGKDAVKIPLKKRFWFDGTNHYLLVGAKVADINNLPTGDLVFDPSITQETVTNDADGGVEDWGDWHDDWGAYIGDYDDSNFEHAGIRFQTIPDIAQGNTITDATLTVEAGSTTETTVIFICYGDIGANYSGAWGSSSRPTSGFTDSSAGDTVTIDASGDWVDGTEYELDITDCVQDIVNLSGYSTNDNMRFALKAQGSSTNGSHIRINVDDWDDYPPTLDIEYTVGGVTVPPLAMHHYRQMRI